jgi:GPH family glycoside/pentoside/hexuronide:cation symporter
MVKVGYGIAGALSGVIITVVGFNSDLATTDQQAAVDGLHAFFCFFPMIGTILAMLIMRNYSITEERAHEIRAQLEKRKNTQITNN